MTSPRRIAPEDAGLSVDYLASVAEAGGKQSWIPSGCWHYFTGGDDLDAVIAVDETAVRATVAGSTQASGTPAKDGAWSFTGTRVRAIDPSSAKGSTRSRAVTSSWRRTSATT